MNNEHHRGARSGTKAESTSPQQAVVVAFPDRRAVTVECGSGWYHDAAIKQAAQSPERQH